MSFVTPEYSKSKVDKAGEILMSTTRSNAEQAWAIEVLSNWRASHGYPINTFQATLRGKLKRIDKKAIVAQRLKRTPSILVKLHRFPTMKLARMQDIGGLRTVVSSIAKVRALETDYRSGKLPHEMVSYKDYITHPKPDGYRGVHLIYRYSNPRAPAYDGLHLELQIRTRLQHAWATAVETMGTFLGEALKSGQGDLAWREFFIVASAAVAVAEKSHPVPGFEGKTELQVYNALKRSESSLRVIERLQGFAIAADHIETIGGKGSYHLVVLDSEKKMVTIRPYPLRMLEQANKDYSEIEQRAKNGEGIEAVLVSAGPIEALKKAYPNYFLDTQAFISQVQKMIAQAGG